MEKAELEKLKAGYDKLKEENSDFNKQLEDGLLIALSGGVAQDFTRFRVSTPNVYYCQLSYQPERWICTCPQGASFGPTAGSFCGYPGRICKHIAALAICLQSTVWPDKPATLLEYVRRVIRSGITVEGIRELPNSRGAQLVEITDKKGAVLCLRLGNYQSLGIARLDSDSWTMDMWAEKNYRDWVHGLQ